MKKQQIEKALRSLNTTFIFKTAKLCGVNVDNRHELMKWIEKNSPSQKVYKHAYYLSYCASDKNNIDLGGCLRMPVSDAIRHAKMQKSEGSMSTNYGKILIEGNKNIYWAHPGYKHSDYNKSRALENTPKNRKLMNLINRFLTKNG